MRSVCDWASRKKPRASQNSNFFHLVHPPQAQNLWRVHRTWRRNQQSSGISALYRPTDERSPRTTYKVCCTTQCMSPCVLYVCVCLDYYGPCVVSIFSIFSHFRLLFSANFFNKKKIVQSPVKFLFVRVPSESKTKRPVTTFFFLNFCLFKQIVKRSRSKVNQNQCNTRPKVCDCQLFSSATIRRLTRQKRRKKFRKCSRLELNPPPIRRHLLSFPTSFWKKQTN